MIKSINFLQYFRGFRGFYQNAKFITYKISMCSIFVIISTEDSRNFSEFLKFKYPLSYIIRYQIQFFRKFYANDVLCKSTTVRLSLCSKVNIFSSTAFYFLM